MQMRVLRTGLSVALVVDAVTALVGCACLFGGIKTLGPVDYVLYPGGTLGWLWIWGDTYSNSVGERLGVIGISMAANALAGFILGVFGAAIWKAGRRFWTRP